MRNYSPPIKRLNPFPHKSAGIDWFLIACLLLLCTSCADYESGYEHGYRDIEARSWLVLGREEYAKGYEEGQMQAFQDDWYAENADEIVVGRDCPLAANPARLAIFTRQHGFIDL